MIPARSFGHVNCCSTAIIAAFRQKLHLMHRANFPGQLCFQLGDQGFQGGHGAIESKIAPRRQTKSSCAAAEMEEFHGLLHIRLAWGGEVYCRMRLGRI